MTTIRLMLDGPFSGPLGTGTWHKSRAWTACFTSGKYRSVAFAPLFICQGGWFAGWTRGRCEVLPIESGPPGSLSLSLTLTVRCAGRCALLPRPGSADLVCGARYFNADIARWQVRRAWPMCSTHAAHSHPRPFFPEEPCLLGVARRFACSYAAAQAVTGCGSTPVACCGGPPDHMADWPPSCACGEVGRTSLTAWRRPHEPAGTAAKLAAA